MNSCVVAEACGLLGLCLLWVGEALFGKVVCLTANMKSMSVGCDTFPHTPLIVLTCVICKRQYKYLMTQKAAFYITPKHF